MNLALEVDGQVHDTGTNPQRDHYREQWLLGQGIQVLHIPAIEVLKSMDGVISTIISQARQ